MKLELRRYNYGSTYTIGRLYIDGYSECVTLEDTVREVSTRPVREWKIPDRTAIPRGTYIVTVTHSARFGRMMPLLNNVPGFTGVRIHAGNSSANTEGCILVGKKWTEGDWITQSRLAYDALYAKISAAVRSGDHVTIEVG